MQPLHRSSARHLPLFLVLAGCYQECGTHAEDRDLDIVAELPELLVDCAPSTEEVSPEEGVRVISQVERDGDVCRAMVFASAAILDLDDLEERITSDMEYVESARLRWDSVVATIDALDLVLDAGSIPADSTLTLEQLLLGDEAEQLSGETALLMAANPGAASIVGSSTHLLGVDYLFDGTEGDDASDQFVVTTNPDPGPAVAAATAWSDGDAQLHLVTLGIVEVPMAALQTAGPVRAAIGLDETVRFTGTFVVPWGFGANGDYDRFQL